MRILLGVCILCLCAVSASAATESLVLFLDGARIERELVARKGYLEMPLPDKILADSLRVKPIGDCSVQRVLVVPVAPDRRHDKEAASLEERKVVLQDRLKILEEREGIFKSAVKSQSSRAVRKTKNNPEPLESVRKGTAFAVAQLESVQMARRKTERELAVVEARLKTADTASAAGSVARVWLSRPDGRARISFVVSGLMWTPWYDFRLSGNGNAETVMRAKLPNVGRAASISVVPLALAAAYGAEPVSYPVSTDLAAIASFRLPVTQESVTAGPVSFLSFTFTNSSGKSLPAGEACGYSQGEYLGKTHFSGCSSGESRQLVFGRQ